MRDPLHWSLPVGRFLGVSFRVHIALPLVVLGLSLREWTRPDAPADTATAILAVMGLFLLSVFVHELGHLFVARSVGGDAEELVLWPLGGLATCDVPHSPRASLAVSLGGPAINLFLCASCAAILIAHSIAPPLNLFADWTPFHPKLVNWVTGEQVVPMWHVTLAARLFWLNWVLLLFNLIPAPPLDAGYSLHAFLWKRSDFREAWVNAAYVGFGFMLCLFVVAIWRENVLLFGLVAMIYLNCRSHFVQGELTGEESSLGYDFSQGYSSLERTSAAPMRRHRPNFLQRWMQKRAARRALAEQQEREAEEQRMDELLEKVQEHGLTALTEEERRFLSRVSARYRK